ncbi:MAG: ferrochelatase [Alphaproteobacteria bacterium]|nr:ferrochelatase [Alphaproteobacteria bacterium]
MTRTAIVLFNLGGPDAPASVQPFLFNLFSDPAIIGLPNPLRWLVAKLISSRRAPTARHIYGQMGGGSPILPNTLIQARALEAALADLGEVRCFPAMRYWHPMTDAAAREVAAYAPARILLLPLYPQYSTTTTASSMKAWHEAARAAGITAPMQSACCYPRQPGFIAALADLIGAHYAKAVAHGKPRILFSAHGLPKKVIDAGDPYQAQVEMTVGETVSKLGIRDLDHVVCYQSRVGPLEWIGPSTEDEVKRAGRDRVPAVVVPVAFVSEHSETLVELDIEYRKLAEDAGVPYYTRVPAVSAHPEFIRGLAEIARALVRKPPAVPVRICPGRCGKCPTAAA